MHEDEEEPDLECPICHHSFHSYGMLEAHMDEHSDVCRRCHKNPPGEEGLCFICRTYRPA